MATKQIIFTLGDNEYGLDITLVNAIENYTDIVPIPNAPSYILGILNLRGDVIPVYSLRKKFGMPEMPGQATTQLLVTKCKDITVGYKVDSVSEIIDVSDAEFHETPIIVKGEQTRYVAGVASKKDRLIVLLDSENILSEMESESVKRVVENA